MNLTFSAHGQSRPRVVYQDLELHEALQIKDIGLRVTKLNQLVKARLTEDKNTDFWTRLLSLLRSPSYKNSAKQIVGTIESKLPECSRLSGFRSFNAALSASMGSYLLESPWATDFLLTFLAKNKCPSMEVAKILRQLVDLQLPNRLYDPIAKSIGEVTLALASSPEGASWIPENFGRFARYLFPIWEIDSLEKLIRAARTAKFDDFNVALFEAKTLRFKGQYAEAIALIDSALKKYPDRAAVLKYELSGSLWLANKYREALEAIDTSLATAISPNDKEWFTLRKSEILTMEGRADAAEALLRNEQLSFSDSFYGAEFLYTRTAIAIALKAEDKAIWMSRLKAYQQRVSPRMIKIFERKLSAVTLLQRAAASPKAIESLRKELRPGSIPDLLFVDRILAKVQQPK